MSQKTQKFLRMAVQCEEKAHQTQDPALRRQLEVIARGWRHLAELSESSAHAVQFISRSIDDD